LPAPAIAFFPPMMAADLNDGCSDHPHQEADFDIAQEIAALTGGVLISAPSSARHLPGQRERQPIAALTLEHYPGMVRESSGMPIAHVALATGPGLTVIHRVTALRPVRTSCWCWRHRSTGRRHFTRPSS
jgi:hypothetical protein